MLQFIHSVLRWQFGSLCQHLTRCFLTNPAAAYKSYIFCKEIWLYIISPHTAGIAPQNQNPLLLLFLLFKYRSASAVVTVHSPWMRGWGEVVAVVLGLPSHPSGSAALSALWLHFDGAAGRFALVAVEKRGSDHQHRSQEKHPEGGGRSREIYMKPINEQWNTQLSLRPRYYPVGLKSFRRKYEMRVETMIDTEVANPFRMLSAYFITTAMTSPPTACTQTDPSSLKLFM